MEKIFTIEEFIDASNVLLKDIAESTPDIMQVVALDSIGFIKKRIIDNGESSNGSRFPGYSETELPAFFYHNKATNAAGRKIVEDRKKEKRGLSYKDFKSANNGPESVRVKNFLFTGDMFRQLAVLRAGYDGKSYKVIVGEKTEKAQNKLDWNSEKYGDLLVLNKEEEKGISKTYNDSIQAIITKNGF